MLVPRALLGLLIVMLITSPAVAHLQELPVPANTKLSLQLLSPISTATSKKGDKFSCKVLTPAEYAGAIVEGHIRDLKRSGKADKDSRIDLAFDKITLADARVEEFSATVVEVFDVINVGDQGRADNEGGLRSRSTTVKTSIKRAATGAILGAIIGGVVAGGKGAALGAAIGAGVGATTVLATKGPDLEFKDGTQFTVECSGPRKKRNSGTEDSTIASVPPELPATEYRAYTSNREFTANTPANWRETTSAAMVSFAPAGGYLDLQGKPNMTHGAMFGVVPSQVVDLQKAADKLVGALLQRNPHMHQTGSYLTETIGGRNALAATLIGVGPITHRSELVTVHTAPLRDGTLFYLITVVPEQEYGTYREAFDHVLRSINFNN